MSIIRISLLLITMLVTSCSAQNVKQESNVNCERFSINTSTEYSGPSEDIKKVMQDFNSENNKSLDIVRIVSESGYDYSEKLKRVYIENDKLYVYNGNNLVEGNGNITSASELFKEIKNDSIYINCKNRSSLNTTYRYFIKSEGKLIFTFYSNKRPENIDRNLIKDEYHFFDFFERL